MKKLINAAKYSLYILLSVFKRVFGMIAFLLVVVILGSICLVLVFPMYGIDKANDIMDRYCLPLVELWD